MAHRDSKAHFCDCAGGKSGHACKHAASSGRKKKSATKKRR